MVARAEKLVRNIVRRCCSINEVDSRIARTATIAEVGPEPEGDLGASLFDLPYMCF
jgi:hypothetical protein